MVYNWGKIVAIILPNVGGWASTLTMKGEVTTWYEKLKKPSWTPPNWVFGPTWTVLYCGMGYASYMVFKECGGLTADAALPLSLYGTQLLLNWAWTPLFFKYHRIGHALLHLSVTDIAATACAISFAIVHKGTACFMVPYLGWLGFATALNYKIWKLNKDGDTHEE